MTYVVKTTKGYVKVLNAQEDVALKKNITEATKFEYRIDAVFFKAMLANSVIIELNNES